jgi:diguanylate cyclase (GGDEF)-like protein
MMKKNSISNSFQEVKRKIYLFSLPLVIIATIGAWVVESFDQDIDVVNKISLPILLIWLTCFFTVVVLKKNILYMEIITFIFLTVFHAFRFYFVIDDGLGAGINDLDEYTFWIPMYYIYIFLVFKRKKALYISLTIFFLTLLMWIYELVTDMDSQAGSLDTIIQFYVSSLVYIISLFFLHHTVEIYLKSEAFHVMAYTDYLTKLPNRRMIEDWMEKEISKAKKFKTPLSVIVLDIDYFKKINDTFGHDTGDIVLQELSNLIRGNIRDTDYLGRWGGEEFMIIATNQNKQQAKQLANRLRESIEQHQFTHGESVTSSFGVSELNDVDDSRAIMKRADQALYMAKNNGRNQVCDL